MAAVWHGSLLNSPIDVAIDSSILVFGIWAYTPQILRLRESTSMRGLSAYFLLANVLLSNVQLSQTLLYEAFRLPSRKHPVLNEIRHGQLTGLRAFGATLGMLQFSLQAFLALITLISLVLIDSGSRAATLWIGTVVGTGLLHFAIFVLGTLAIVANPEKEFCWDTLDIFTGLVPIVNQLTAPFAIFLQLLTQYHELRAQHGVPGALSLETLGLQIIFFTLLAFRWILRLERPMEIDPRYPVHAPFDFARRQYEWAFPAANYIIQALVCAFLFFCYRSYGQMEEHPVPESAPLLG